VTAAAGDAARQVRSQPSLNTRGLAGREETLSGGRDTQQYFPTAEFGYIDVVPAFATFTDRLDVYVDDLKLELDGAGRHLRRFAEMIEFNSGPIRCFA
jgi:hypothetical protein